MNRPAVRVCFRRRLQSLVSVFQRGKLAFWRRRWWWGTMMRQRCRFWPAMRPLALLSVIVPASAVAADPLPISSPYLELIRDPAVHVELGL